jgi:hypothetical protein
MAPSPPDQGRKRQMGIDEGGPGARIATRLLVILGVVVIIAGLGIWADGSSNYSACTASNKYLNGVVAASNCSQTLGRVGFILFLAGVGLVVLAFLLYFARHRAPAAEFGFGVSEGTPIVEPLAMRAGVLVGAARPRRTRPG